MTSSTEYRAGMYAHERGLKTLSICIYCFIYRVAECRDELTGINNRILTAQAKINKLRSSSTKATRVFSSPKYPAPERVRDYHSIYQDFNPALHRVFINRNACNSDSRPNYIIISHPWFCLEVGISTLYIIAMSLWP